MVFFVLIFCRNFELTVGCQYSGEKKRRSTYREFKIKLKVFNFWPFQKCLILNFLFAASKDSCIIKNKTKQKNIVFMLFPIIYSKLYINNLFFVSISPNKSFKTEELGCLQQCSGVYFVSMSVTNNIHQICSTDQALGFSL